MICSITLLTKRKAFWIAGIVVAIGGLVFAATGFLVHLQ